MDHFGMEAFDSAFDTPSRPAQVFRGWLVAQDLADGEAAVRLGVSPEWVRAMQTGRIDTARLGPALAVRLLQVTQLCAEDLGLEAADAVSPDEVPPIALTGVAEKRADDMADCDVMSDACGAGGGGRAIPSPPKLAAGWFFHLEPTGEGPRIVCVRAGDGYAIEQSWTVEQARAFAADMQVHIGLASAPGSVPA